MPHTYLYSVVCEALTHPDIGPYKAYGIKASAGDPPAMVGCVSDISTVKAKVQELATKYNELELSPCHLCDVVEDFLTE